MKFLARRQLNGLAPVDGAGEDVLRKLKIGDVVTVEVKKARNPNHHRKYWALVGLVFENQERYATAEELHTALKLAAGICYPVKTPDGRTYWLPKSISFEDMDQIQFNAFYDKVCGLVVEEFLPGVSNAELRAEIENICGAAA